MNIALMTTCKPRLDNYKKEVMESILAIAPQVDRLFIVLSLQEFENKIPKLDLPDNVTIVTCLLNTYSFKKFYPLVDKAKFNISSEDNVFLVDDDWRYHSDYVKYMLDYRGDKDVAALGNGGCIGAFTLLKAKCIQPDFFKYWCKELIETRIDDIYLTNYINWKGYTTKYYDKCVDELVRTVADPLIPESANNPGNSIYPKTFAAASSYQPWKANYVNRRT